MKNFVRFTLGDVLALYLDTIQYTVYTDTSDIGLRENMPTKEKLLETTKSTIKCQHNDKVISEVEDKMCSISLAVSFH